MYNKNKRGILLKQVIEIIIAIIIILIIIFAFQRILSTYFGNQKEMQAKGTLASITQKLNSLNESETISYLLQAPSGWHLVAFDVEHNENKEFVKASSYFRQNVLCICEKKNCKLCQPLKMPLMQGPELALIKIELADLWLTNAKTYYNLSKVKPTVPTTLTEEEKTEVQLQTITTNQQIKDYETIIDETAKKYYPQVKDYVANEQEFKKIIKGIITIESQGSWNAIGTSGEVGLMQIMPQVSIDLGLKTFDPNDKIKNTPPGPARWSDEILIYLKTDYVTELRTLKNTKTKNELIAIDERFDEAKNIDTGTKHLASLITQLKDWELGIIAYNAGSPEVEKKCKPLVITACNTEFEGFKYLQRVKATIA